MCPDLPDLSKINVGQNAIPIVPEAERQGPGLQD